MGPDAIRRASLIFDGDRDPQYPSGLNPCEVLDTVDFGDLNIADDVTKVPKQIEDYASALIEGGQHLITLGGDHFITLPLLRAHVKKHGKLALVHFDAHQDTWDDDGTKISHGTFVTRAVAEDLIDVKRSVQIGIRTVAPKDYGIRQICAYDCNDVHTIANTVSGIVRGPAYLTFDIDVLDPAFAPGTGTPVAGGLDSRTALSALWKICMRSEFVGMDVVEVCPPYDQADITAVAASTVVQHYLQALAKKKAEQIEPSDENIVYLQNEQTTAQTAG